MAKLDTVRKSGRDSGLRDRLLRSDRTVGQGLGRRKDALCLVLKQPARCLVERYRVVDWRACWGDPRGVRPALAAGKNMFSPN